MFQGLPLLAHSVRHARESRRITRTIVSTDSVQYADVARQFGADVPFLRPVEIAGDISSDLEVFQHALDWLAREEGYEPEICVHLRPTSPIRRVSDIDAIVQWLIDHADLDSVRSVTLAAQTPFKMWFRDDAGLLAPVLPTAAKDASSLPRQVLPIVYVQNACIDAVRTRVIREQHSMTGQRVYGYVMSGHDDIDTEEDFQRAAARAGTSDPESRTR